MSFSRSMGVDEFGIETIYHDLGDRVVIQKKQDVSKILDDNVRRSNAVSGRMGEMVHIAHIPFNVIDQWTLEDGINYWSSQNKRAILKKLHDISYKKLKTHPGNFL